MASKKQQSRVAKAKRHGLGRHAYEYVMVDEEGNEIEVEEADKPASGKVKRSSGGGKAAAGQKPARRVKEPQPPSLKRLGKRSALFVPLILLLTLSQKKISVESRVIQAVIFLVVFVVLMWGSDHLVWKIWQKRQAKEAAARGGKPGGRPGSGGKG